MSTKHEHGTFSSLLLQIRTKTIATPGSPPPRHSLLDPHTYYPTLPSPKRSPMESHIYHSTLPSPDTLTLGTTHCHSEGTVGLVKLTKTRLSCMISYDREFFQYDSLKTKRASQKSPQQHRFTRRRNQEQEQFSVMCICCI